MSSTETAKRRELERQDTLAHIIRLATDDALSNRRKLLCIEAWVEAARHGDLMIEDSPSRIKLANAMRASRARAADAVQADGHGPATDVQGEG